MKGYKIFSPEFKCRDFQFAEGQEYKLDGELVICQSGFHFCLKAQDCFSYYSFSPDNVVCEVEALGKTVTHSDDSKVATDHIKIVRRLSWAEVLEVANSGRDNTGYSNSGYRNSGSRNSGDRNSGYSNSGSSNSGSWNSGYRNSGSRNSGDRNSGDRNSGDRNSGSSNSGDRNSGSWNSGSRNSGDSNSGYRNSGAFCLDNNPKVILFDKITDIHVRDWENHRAVQLMSNLDPTLWIPSSMMTDEEKTKNPKYETTDGYLKTITLKEAWVNMWGNLSDKDKEVFTTLPNFNADSFEAITGIRV